MRVLLLLSFLVSCAHQTISHGPSWVSSIRSGEEKLKVSHGSKTYYRRIAGGPELSKQTACELVVLKAEEDIRKEYPLYPKIPFTVEVLYYDDFHKDCAVTVSLEKEFKVSEEELALTEEKALKRMAELQAKETVTPDEAAEIINLRSEIATKFALTGLTLGEFEKFSREKVSLIQETSLCSETFQARAYSIHGKIEVCWQNDHVKGFCTPKSRQCWIRTP